jgi:hypothetical protein
LVASFVSSVANWFDVTAESRKSAWVLAESASRSPSATPVILAVPASAMFDFCSVSDAPAASWKRPTIAPPARAAATVPSSRCSPEIPAAARAFASTSAFDPDAVACCCRSTFLSAFVSACRSAVAPASSPATRTLIVSTLTGRDSGGAVRRAW